METGKTKSLRSFLPLYNPKPEEKWLILVLSFSVIYSECSYLNPLLNAFLF
jgi:hypothetical protein